MVVSSELMVVSSKLTWWSAANCCTLNKNASCKLLMSRIEIIVHTLPNCKKSAFIRHPHWELRTQLEPSISNLPTVYFLPPPPPEPLSADMREEL
jgi:hypothetical protein